MIEFAVAGLSDPVQATVPWLSLSILVPIVGALLIPFIPDQGEGLKYLETGRAQFYALIVFAGVIAMVVLFGVIGGPIS